MPKFMNNHYGVPMFFWDADKGGSAGSASGGEAGDGGGQDGDDDDDPDEGAEDEPKYTQADLDKAIARTIAKERRKAEKAQSKANKGKGESGDDAKPDKAGESEDAKALRAEKAKSDSLQVKVACFEADVSKDAVDDVAALARAYMAADEDLDLEDAIEKVVKKYPQFKKSAADADPYDDEKQEKGAWGQKQKGKGAKKEKSLEDEITDALYGKM